MKILNPTANINIRFALPELHDVEVMSARSSYFDGKTLVLIIKPRELHIPTKERLL